MKKIVAGFIFVFILIIASLALSVFNNNNITEATEWVEHTNDVIFQCDILTEDAIQLETNNLGYFISQKKIYANNVIARKPKIAKDLLKLKNLTRDNPRQKAQITLLEVEFNKKITFSETIISLVSIANLEQAQKLINEGAGLDIMKNIQGTLQIIKTAEKELLKTRTAKAKNLQYKFFRTSIITTFIAILALLLGYYFVLHTLRARKKHYAEIFAQNKLLQQQNERLEQFTYITTHDLQEPLLSLVSLTELLQNECAENISAEMSTYIKYISQASKRMQTLVKGIMEYSRIGAEEESVIVDCNEIVNEVLTDLSHTLKQLNAKVTVDHLPKVIGYRLELRLLFQNLISNALKFRKKDVIPEIKISAKEDVDHWFFSVQDNGIGIKEQDKDKIFVLFKRLHDRNEYEGTGIGLSHCEKIARIHGGTIWAESKFGEGTVFNFTIRKKA
jgi:signal transduction histidine kinase